MRQLLAFAARARAWPAWSRIAAATCLALIALITQVLLTSNAPSHTFLLFFPAVFLGAVFFGKGAATWCVLLSAALSAYFLMEPEGFAVADPVEALALVLFVCISLLIVLVSDELTRELDQLHGDAHAVEESLRRAIESDRLKSLLLKEMAHRTKNDLQFLSTMLQVEGRALDNDKGKASLLAAASRIGVVGRVHSLLQRDDPGLVEMKPLIDDLCADLEASAVGLRPIALRTETQNCLLPLDRARSAALIVNELVTNSLKYAFPDERTGTVRVRLTRNEAAVELIVEDDGVGLEIVGPSKGNGFGHTLLRSLAHQLDGVLTIGAAEVGTRCVLRFPAPSA